MTGGAGLPPTTGLLAGAGWMICVALSAKRTSSEEPCLGLSGLNGATEEGAASGPTAADDARGFLSGTAPDVAGSCVKEENRSGCMKWKHPKTAQLRVSNSTLGPDLRVVHRHA